VNCDSGETIQAALDTLGPVGPHTITVTGTCRENIGIYASTGITIEAPPGQTATIINARPQPRVVIYVASSRAVVFRRLNIQAGSIGMLVDQASEVTIEDCTFENTSRGILLFQGSSIISYGTLVFRNHAGAGMELDEGSVAVFGNATFENNRIGISLGNGSGGTIGKIVIRGGRVGLSLRTGAVANISEMTIEDNEYGVVVGASTANFGDMVIQGNSVAGVYIAENSSVTFSGQTFIRNNGSAGANPMERSGIRVSRSSLTFVNGPEISNNTGPGILVDTKSDVTLTGASIHNNTEEGLRVLRMSVVWFPGVPTIAGNGGASISCDRSSFVFGDLTSIGKTDCKNIEGSKK